MKKRKFALLGISILIGSMIFGSAALAAGKTSTRSTLKSRGRIELDINGDGDLQDADDVLFDATDLERIADKLDEIEATLE